MASVKLEQSPIVRLFTLSIMKTILSQISRQEKKYIINADLVPKVSERIIKPKMLSTQKTSFIRPKPELHKLIAPIKQAPKQIKQPLVQPRTIPASEVHIEEQEYGKIAKLLKDPTITYIESSGPGKQLVIMRAGQRQLTKITLNPKEIKQLLEKISEKARIPLIEGIFRAAVDNFVINAIISEVIGSRFIIKKQTPYNLLEPK